MLKRLVVVAFVSSLSLFGLAPAASAAPSSDLGATTTHVSKQIKLQRGIDWD